MTWTLVTVCAHLVVSTTSLDKSERTSAVTTPCMSLAYDKAASMIRPSAGSSCSHHNFVPNSEAGNKYSSSAHLHFLCIHLFLPYSCIGGFSDVILSCMTKHNDEDGM